MRRTWKLGSLEFSFESVSAPGEPSTGVLWRGLLVLPLVAVFIVRIVGIVVFHWSATTDDWPAWYAALFALAIGCTLLYVYLRRRDRSEAV
jgi:uncharacterized integral membrane protein